MPRYGVYTDVGASSADLETRLTALSNRIPTTGVFNVKDAAYGAVGNGVADDSAAVQAALTALVAAGGGTLYFPTGSYYLGSLVSAQTSGTNSALGIVQIRGDGRGSVLLPQVAPIFRIGNTTDNTDGFIMRDLRVKLTKDLGWTNGIVHLRIVREFLIENVLLIGGDGYGAGGTMPYGGILFELDDSYEGVFVNCEARGRKTVLVDCNSDTLAGQQQDQIQFIGCKAYSVYGAFIRTTSGNYHGITFENFKHVLTVSGMVEAAENVETTLSNSPSAAGTSFTVASAAGLAVGDLLLVGKGSTAEIIQIGTIVGTTITLDATANASGLRFAHSAAEPVLHGGVGVSVSSNTYSFVMREPHFELGAVGVMLDGTRSCNIVNPYNGSRDVIRCVGVGVQDIRVDGGSYAGQAATNNIVRVTTAADDANFARLMLIGPFTTTSGGVTLVPYVNDAGTERVRRTIGQNSSGIFYDEQRFPTSTNLEFDRVYVNGTKYFARNLNGEQYGAGDLNFGGGYRQTIDGWYQENVAASQSGVLLTRLATTTNNPAKWIGTRAGSVTGVSVHSNATIAAGTLTITVYIAGVAQALTAVLDTTNNTYKATTAAKDTYPFSAGAQVDVRVTTDAGFLPTTADIRVAIEVET